MTITITFNNWAEVGDWWSKNPTAIRTSPELQDEDETISILEYNERNHSLEFPCEMTFVL